MKITGGVSESNWMDDLRFGDVIEYTGQSAEGQRIMVIGHVGARLAAVYLDGPTINGESVKPGEVTVGRSKEYASLWRKVEP